MEPLVSYPFLIFDATFLSCSIHVSPNILCFISVKSFKTNNSAKIWLHNPLSPTGDLHVASTLICCLFRDNKVFEKLSSTNVENLVILARGMSIKDC